MFKVQSRANANMLRLQYIIYINRHKNVKQTFLICLITLDVKLDFAVGFMNRKRRKKNGAHEKEWWWQREQAMVARTNK